MTDLGREAAAAPGAEDRASPEGTHGRSGRILWVDDEVDLLWEVCPFTGPADEGYPCVFPEGMPPGMQEAMTGRGETFDFEYAMDLAFFVEFFCASQAGLVEQLPEGLPIPNCDQGYPARARLTAGLGTGR